MDGHRPSFIEGRGVISCRFKSIPLLPQRFNVKMKILKHDGKEIIMDYEDVASFIVAANLEEYGYKGEFLSRVNECTPVVSPYEWHLPDGTIATVSLNNSVPELM